MFSLGGGLTTLVKRNADVVYYELGDLFIWTIVKLPNGELIAIANVYFPPTTS